MVDRNIHGIHAPNVPFAQLSRFVDGPPEPGALLYRFGAAKVSRVKLLWPQHNRGDALLLNHLGIKVLVRAPGEGIVHHEDVQKMMSEFSGVAEVIEVGNEPALRDDVHAWYLEDVYQKCAKEAFISHGITLCAPGWQAGQLPPLLDPTIDHATAARLDQVYRLYPYQAVHVYDPYDLTTPAPQAHLKAWLDWRPTLTAFFITEYGIACRYLVHGNERASWDLKAQRYAAFLKTLPPQVVAAYAFIAGGTNDFAVFGSGGYDPKGGNSYWLDDAAWDLLGTLVVSK